MNNKIFRKEALVRIESPERLNEMVKITSPRSWLVLIALIGIITAFILWSILGELPYTINGQGILQQQGGVIEVEAIAPGRIESIIVKEGDFIKENDIIAYIDQLEIEMQIDNAKKELKDYNKRYDRISDFGYENLELKRELYKKEEINLTNKINLNIERLKFIEDKIKAQEELLERGLITAENLNKTKEEYFKIQQENDILLNNKKELRQKEYEIIEQNEIQLNQLKSEILNIENRIRELEALFELNSKIISPYTGKIIELMVNPGKVINAGSPIISIEPSNISNDLQAVIYVNPREGKKIEPKMKVKLSPSTIEVEEYGYINGIVDKVSEYPSSVEGMLRTLGNNELVKTFTKEGPPIAITVNLIKDSATYSSYSWTSKNGPEQFIKSGTLCLSKIITETRRPISLLFPKITNKLESSFTHKAQTKVAKQYRENSIETDSNYIPISKTELSEHFTVQIAATKSALSKIDLNRIYSGSEEINEAYINGWYKYSIGNFNTKEKAKDFIDSNNMQGKAFVRCINNSIK